MRRAGGHAHGDLVVELGRGADLPLEAGAFDPLVQLRNAPLHLLRCEAGGVRATLDALHRHPEVVRVEEVFPESHPLEDLLRAPAAHRSSPHPLIGIADIGALDRGHPRAVLHALMEAKGSLDPGRVLYEELRPESGPFAWLLALDRLVSRGADLINLSYGRRAIERREGWAVLEWGPESLCRASGVVMVAAAGQPTDHLADGFDLHLPASSPCVIPADGPERWWGDPPGDGEDRIFLASREAPFGGPPGSSFAAPRIAALVCEILEALPREWWDRERVKWTLQACCDPPPRGIPARGTPNPECLREMLRGETRLEKARSKAHIRSLLAAGENDDAQASGAGHRSQWGDGSRTHREDRGPG